MGIDKTLSLKGALPRINQKRRSAPVEVYQEDVIWPYVPDGLTSSDQITCHGITIDAKRRIRGGGVKEHHIKYVPVINGREQFKEFGSYDEALQFGIEQVHTKWLKTEQEKKFRK